MEWFESLNSLQRIFFYMAVPSTLVLIIQSVLLLVGFGHGPEADTPDLGHGMPDSSEMPDTGGDTSVDDHDIPDGGLRLFTVRGIVAFFTICGWSGMAMAASGTQPVINIILAIIFGLIALVGVALILKASLKLQQAGNLNLANAIGQTGKVYIPIPAATSGTGKVMLEVQGRLIEADAMTKAATTLSTGTGIKVAGVINETLIVEPFEL